MQPCWFSQQQRRAEKGWLVVCLTLSPHILALFMTSLIQTDGHKMSAPTITFSLLSNIVFCFVVNSTRNQMKNCCLLFYLIPEENLCSVNSCVVYACVECVVCMRACVSQPVCCVSHC